MPIRPKRKTGVPKKVNAVIAAQAAADAFEEERSRLLDMKKEFRAEFPEANEFLQEVMRQEDLVHEKIKVAIPLIREAKQDVGDFKCQLKQSSANYDEKEFISLVTEIEEGGAILIELIEGGFVKKLALEPGVANYFAQHPDAAEHFQSAWRDAKDLTPAVTPPKF